MTETGFREISAELREQEQALAGGDYRRWDRRLKSATGGTPLRMTLLGNVTLDPLAPFLRVEFARQGVRADIRVGGYAQCFQDLRSPELLAFDAEMLFLSLSLAHMRPDAMNSFTGLTVAQRMALRDDVIAEVEAWAQEALTASSATLLVANFPMPAAPLLGVADAAEEYGETEFLLDLNMQLMRRLRGYARVQMFDTARIAATIGAHHAYDVRMLHIAKSEWTDVMLAAIARECTRHFIAAKGLSRKCLVLDLDNTLWGGVVGEDGPFGVRIGIGDPEGEAFLRFQHRVRALKARGILLAICSKNNPDEVDEIFRIRTEMPLRLEDMSAVAVGWNSKAEGLTEIAARLNIGTDALVFLDDNPAEIAAIRHLLPGVEAVLLPRDPAFYVAALDGLLSFEKARVTSEDAAKAEHYAEQNLRSAAAAAAAGPAEYLASLEMRATVREAGPADLVRLHQLFTKTNQFNVTSRRYSMGELEGMLASPSYRVVIASVRDRFGDLGYIGACVTVQRPDSIHIDSLLLSCRAMNRGVEHLILNDIKEFFLDDTQLPLLTAEFVSTSRNEPARDVFLKAGFRRADADGGIFFELTRSEVKLEEIGWITMGEDQLVG